MEGIRCEREGERGPVSIKKRGRRNKALVRSEPIPVYDGKESRSFRNHADWTTFLEKAGRGSHSDFTGWEHEVRERKDRGRDTVVRPGRL